MISDPEIIQAIDDYLANGGEVHHIPFGVSGYTRFHGMHPGTHHLHRDVIGWALRFGLDLIPEDAITWMEAGLVTVVQIRAPVVWKTMHAAGVGLPSDAIASVIRISTGSVRRSLELLEDRRLCLSYRESRQIYYRALGDEVPSWRSFVRAPQLEFRSTSTPSCPSLTG